ncbi:MAG: hypothetical protein WC459_04210 [Patescibacteria group bacterium]
MRQLIIENRLLIPIFVQVKVKELNPALAIHAALFFNSPDGATELDTRKIETMEQVIFDLPDETQEVELDPGLLAERVNFEGYEDSEVFFLRLASIKNCLN